MQADSAESDSKLKHYGSICEERIHGKARSNRQKDRHKRQVQEQLATIKYKHAKTIARLETKRVKAKNHWRYKVRVVPDIECQN